MEKIVKYRYRIEEKRKKGKHTLDKVKNLKNK